MDDPGHIESANIGPLMIIYVLVTDWGMYSCKATNIVNSMTSNEATLHGKYMSMLMLQNSCSVVAIILYVIKYLRVPSFHLLMYSCSL